MIQNPQLQVSPSAQDILGHSSSRRLELLLAINYATRKDLSKAMRNNKDCFRKYCIYDRSTTYLILLAFAFLTIAILCLSVFFINRFLVKQFDPLVFPLLLVFIVPYTYGIFEAIRTGYLLRLFLRFRVDAEGFHCTGLGWRHFTISWDSIRTYAVFSQSEPQYMRTLLMFSTSKNEQAPPNYVAANSVSTCKIVIQYRDDVCKVLKTHMPRDMEKNISYALERNQSCFHKR